MLMTDCDVLLVGGGHNGLVCAAYLARAGKKVTVLEAAEQPGGCAATREFAPGYSVSSCAHWLYQLHPEIIRDLGLESHGLRWAARELSTVSLDSAGDHMVVLGDSARGGGISADDLAAYRRFRQKMLKYARLLAVAFTARAPKLVESNLTDRLTLARLGLGMKRMGKEDMSDLMRMILINMYDVMEENFDNPGLKALLSLEGVLGAHMGPRSPNTVFGYLYRLVGEVFEFTGPAQVSGGMGVLGQAMAASARAAGADVRTGARVERIDIDAGRAVGVTLAGGEQLRAANVVSNADPVTTFERLVGFRNLETGMVRRVSQIRNRSGTAKLHLALDGVPSFTGLAPELLGHRLVIAPDMNYIERAFNAVKYHECSAAPIMDISLASINDDSLAPEGKHVLSAIVQFVPYEPAGGWEDRRQSYTDALVDCIAAYAPDIRQHLVASELLTPADLERDYGMTGGNWHHGELSLDQVMMMRPFPGATQYGTAIDGLYLCGAGAHPGGGLMGLAGRNAAKEILRRGSTA
jgi:phytoene dehydrogenase-like protein